MNAADILRAAAGHIDQRAQLRDTPAGERSMARATAGGHNPDDYEDMAAYAALAGECEATDIMDAGPLEPPKVRGAL